METYEALAAQCRRWKYACALLSLLLAMVIFAGAAPRQESAAEPLVPKSIQASEFVLRDAAGKVRARMFVDDNGEAKLTLFKPDGKVAFTVPPKPHVMEVGR